MRPNELLNNYCTFNRVAEELGVPVSKLNGTPCRVIDFTDENQMARAGERVIRATRPLQEGESFAEIGKETLKRLCVTLYPNIYGENVPERVYFQLPEQETLEPTLISKIQQFIRQVLAALCISQKHLPKAIEDLEMQQINSNQIER